MFQTQGFPWQTVIVGPFLYALSSRQAFRIAWLQFINDCLNIVGPFLLNRTFETSSSHIMPCQPDRYREAQCALRGAACGFSALPYPAAVVILTMRAWGLLSSWSTRVEAEEASWSCSTATEERMLNPTWLGLMWRGFVTYHLSVSPATKNATGVWVSFSILAPCQPLWGYAYTISKILGMTGFTLPSWSIPDSFGSKIRSQTVHNCAGEYGIWTIKSHNCLCLSAKFACWTTQKIVQNHDVLKICVLPALCRSTLLSTLTPSLAFKVTWESLSARSVCCALSATAAHRRWDLCWSGVSLLYECSVGSYLWFSSACNRPPVCTHKAAFGPGLLLQRTECKRRSCCLLT